MVNKDYQKVLESDGNRSIRGGVLPQAWVGTGSAPVTICAFWYISTGRTYQYQFLWSRRRPNIPTYFVPKSSRLYCGIKWVILGASGGDGIG